MKNIFPEGDELHRFLAREGWASTDAVRQMGAANRHRVFLLERGGRRVVLKMHETAPAGRRDAFAHELLMHSFYAEQMGASVPALMAHDAVSRAILFEYVSGAIVSGRQNDMRDIESMAQFIVESNRVEALQKARQAGVPSASESGASALDHWRCAAARLDELLGAAAEDDFTVRMQDFLRSEVVPALTAGRPSTGVDVQQCLSPSDFGFHNVLRREDGTFCFLDFEHAGWDDPAKLIADFILQPEAPLSNLEARHFSEALGNEAGRRAAQILLIQKCKWTAIILNVFVRSVADSGIKAERLAKAVNYWRAPTPSICE